MFCSLNFLKVLRKSLKGSTHFLNVFSICLYASQSQVFSSGNILFLSGILGSVYGLTGAFNICLLWVLKRCFRRIGSSWGISCRVLIPSSKIWSTVLTISSGSVEYFGKGSPGFKTRSSTNNGIGSFCGSSISSIS